MSHLINNLYELRLQDDRRATSFKLQVQASYIVHSHTHTYLASCQNLIFIYSRAPFCTLLQP